MGMDYLNLIQYILNITLGKNCNNICKCRYLCAILDSCSRIEEELWMMDRFIFVDFLVLCKYAIYDNSTVSNMLHVGVSDKLMLSGHFKAGCAVRPLFKKVTAIPEDARANAISDLSQTQNQFLFPQKHQCVIYLHYLFSSLMLLRGNRNSVCCADCLVCYFFGL